MKLKEIMSSGKSEIPCKKITRFNGLELVPKGKIVYISAT